MLKHCAENRKRRLSALPDVSPYVYDVLISGFTRSSIYIYDISRLRVKITMRNCNEGIWQHFVVAKVNLTPGTVRFSNPVTLYFTDSSNCRFNPL
jgi:hypothetical protein